MAQARANLAKLAPATEDVAAAQASLDAAKANLAKLTAPATATDLQIQQAAVTQAEASSQQAELALDNATLEGALRRHRRPGQRRAGQPGRPCTPAMRLINRNPLHVDLKLSENDVAQVQLGQPVQLTIASLGGWQTDGKVSFVAPAADNANGVVTYAVRVSFPDSDPQVKVGMTADLEIVTARKRTSCWCPIRPCCPRAPGGWCRCSTADDAGQAADDPGSRRADRAERRHADRDHQRAERRPGDRGPAG